MNRMVPLLLAAGLTAAWTGCQPATDSKAPPAPAAAPAAAPADAAPQAPADAAPKESADAAPKATSEYTLVTLKVPNMT